jgi:hypothetical protein
MKRLLIMSVVVFSIILAWNVNAGPLVKGFYFIGLWQGIDPNDGSEVLRSITKNNDGTFNIIGSETFFHGCDGGRGIATGTGVLEDDVLISEDFTLECYDVGTYPGEIQYVPDRLNRTLEEHDMSGIFEPSILHRINKR